MMNKVQNTDRHLLSILVCPDTLSGLVYDPDRNELASLRSRLAFPIQDGVPIMLAAAARPLCDDEHSRLMAGRKPQRDR